MATVRQAGVADRQVVSQFLAPRLGRGDSVAQFERLLDCQWLADTPDIGWIIEDNGNVGGFVGAIYSRRIVRGRLQAFCNVHSFAVDRRYRHLSLAMLKQLLDRTDQTYTCFSASPVALEILRFFKFQTTDATKVIFTPAAGLTRLVRRGITVRRGTEILGSLDPCERAIMEDHVGYRCGHFLLEADGARCYFVTVRRGRAFRAFADVLHASNPELLVKYIAHAQVPVAMTHRTSLIGLDRRLVTARPAGTFLFSKLWPLALKSTSVNISEVDLLYSELVPLCG